MTAATLVSSLKACYNTNSTATDAYLSHFRRLPVVITPTHSHYVNSHSCTLAISHKRDPRSSPHEERNVGKINIVAMVWKYVKKRMAKCRNVYLDNENNG